MKIKIPKTITYLGMEDQSGSEIGGSSYLLAKSLAKFFEWNFCASTIDPRSKTPVSEQFNSCAALLATKQDPILYIAAHGHKDGSFLPAGKGALRIHFKDWTNSLAAPNVRNQFIGIVVGSCSVGSKVDEKLCRNLGLEWIIGHRIKVDWHTSFVAESKILEWMYLHLIPSQKKNLSYLQDRIDAMSKTPPDIKTIVASGFYRDLSMPTKKQTNAIDGLYSKLFHYTGMTISTKKETVKYNRS